MLLETEFLKFVLLGSARRSENISLLVLVQHLYDWSAAKVRSPPILWKNNVLQPQKVALQIERERLSYQALPVCCGAGKILASLRRF